MFDSVSEVARKNSVVIVMTGMGEDGARGAQKLSESGSYVMIQNQETSTIWGMPEAVAKRDIANEILPLELISKRINEIGLK